MDTLSGLSDLPIAPGEYGKGYSGPASFRDMAAFNFLPQHIVANPFTLFYKTDTTEHREKLRRVFPVVLGAKTNEQLLLEHRLSGLHGEEKRLGAEIRRRKASIETWRSQISGSYLRAQELNLLPPGELPGSTTACVAALRQLATRSQQAVLRSPTSTTQEAVGRLEKFRSQEEALDRQLGDARRQLRQIKALDSTIAEYAGDLFRERDRLKGFDWFRNATRGEHECPVCGTSQSSAGAAIEELRESLEDLEKLASASVVTRPRLDTELLALETRIRTVEQQLFGIRRIRQELETEAENAQSAGNCHFCQTAARGE
jgi:DNA repair exonuclease SbcCD ATPase subunit